MEGCAGAESCSLVGVAGWSVLRGGLKGRNVT